MKKNYTLKIILAVLFIILVSLVSFVGVYKGKNLVKDYTLGDDFGDRRVAVFSVNENTTSNTVDGNELVTESSNENKATDEENNEATVENNEVADANQVAENSDSNTTTEGQTNESTDQNQENNQNIEKSEEDKKKEQKDNYKKSKNMIERRLASIKSNQYNIRLNEDNGTIVIEVPSTMDTGNLTEIVAKGKVQVKNQSTSDVIIDSDGIKGATTRENTTSSSYSSPYIELNIEFNKKGRDALKNANTKYTDSEGKEQDATFELTLDDESLYSEKASSFIETAKNGTLSLSLGQSDTDDDLDKKYESAQVLVSVINNGELPVEYKAESSNVITSNLNLKCIAIICGIIGLIMILVAIIKYKAKAILPMISIIGLVALVLFEIRYFNIELTLFAILGVAITAIADYALILRTLKNGKTLKENMVSLFHILIPCMIIFIVFALAPYLELSTLGETLFWGIITLFIYNLIVTRIFFNTNKNNLKKANNK